MSAQRVATRYAKSIIALAQDEGVLDRVYQDMQDFEGLCDNNPEVIAVLKNPIIYSHKKLSILKKLVQDYLHPVTIKAFETIAKKNRIAIVYDIAKAFDDQYEAHNNMQRAVIITTVPLSDNLRTQVTNKVADATGKKVILEEKIDPNIIGGFILQFDNRQIDNSIRGKLNIIRKELAY